MRDLGPLHADAPRLVPDAELPAYRFLGDLHPHPRRDPRGHSYGLPAPAPGLPPDRWREDRSYLLGIDLYHQGFLWEAHEHWEAGFRAATSPAHRDLLQGLVQIAAAMIQAHRGRPDGARFLAGAVVRRLRGVVGTLPPGGRLCGLDPAALLADVERHLAPYLVPAAPGAPPPRPVGPPPRIVPEPPTQRE